MYSSFCMVKYVHEYDKVNIHLSISLSCVSFYVFYVTNWMGLVLGTNRHASYFLVCPLPFVRHNWQNMSLTACLSSHLTTVIALYVWVRPALCHLVSVLLIYISEKMFFRPSLRAHTHTHTHSPTCQLARADLFHYGSKLCPERINCQIIVDYFLLFFTNLYGLCSIRSPTWGSLFRCETKRGIVYHFQSLLAWCFHIHSIVP